MWLLIIESTLTSWTPVISSCRNLKGLKAANIAFKPQTLGWDCSGSGIICSYCSLRELGRPRMSITYILRRESARIIARLRIYNGKFFIGKNWNIVKGTRNRILEYLSNRIRLSVCWRETLSSSDTFPNNTK